MRNIQILFVVTVNFKYSVRYNREILLGKHAKPNQLTQFVRNNRVFVITVIVITEFDCIVNVNLQEKGYQICEYFTRIFSKTIFGSIYEDFF